MKQDNRLVFRGTFLFYLLLFAIFPITAQEPITPDNVHQLTETAHFGYGQVNDIQYAPDGATLFVATPQDVYQYDSQDYTVPPQAWGVGMGYSLNFSPDGTQIIIGGADQTTIRDLVTRQQTATFDGTNGLWIADDDLLVTSRDNQVFVWDIETGEQIRQFEQEQTIDRLLFNQQQNILITFPKQFDAYSGNGDFELFDIETGEHLEPIERQTMTLKDASISLDGHYFAHAGWWGVDVGSWTDGAYAKGGYQQDPTCCNPQQSAVTFTPDGQYLVSGTSNGGVHFWALPSFEYQLGHVYYHNAEVKKIRFHPQMEQFVVVSADGIITVWDLSTDTITAYLDGYSYHPNTLGIQTDNQTLVTATRFGTIWHWDISTQQQTFAQQAYFYGVGYGTIPYPSKITINRQATMLATIVSNSSAVVIRSIDGEVIRHVQRNEQWDFYEVVFSPDNQEVLVTGTRGEILSIHDPDARIIYSENGSSVLYHPDGEHILTDYSGTGWGHSFKLMPIDCEYQNPYLFYNPDLRPVVTYEGHLGAREIGMNRDGSLVIAFHSLQSTVPYTYDTPQILYIWDGATGELRHTLDEFPNHIFQMVFANHSNLLAVYHSDTIDIWDAESGMKLVSIPQAGVAQLIFSHDDSMLIGALADGTIKVWSVIE